MKKTIATLLLAFAAFTAQAQCTFKNTAFKSGEFLAYNLYYNWKFVWVKAGTASMSTVQSQYRGHHSYRSSLNKRCNQRVDDKIIMRATLLYYSHTDLRPHS